MKEKLEDKKRKQWRDKNWEVEHNRLLKPIGEQQLIIDIQNRHSKKFLICYRNVKRGKIARKLAEEKNIASDCPKSDVFE